MMLRLNNLGTVSINYDLEPCDLPPNVMTEGRNFVLRNNVVWSFNTSNAVEGGDSAMTAGHVCYVVGLSTGLHMMVVMGVGNGTTTPNAQVYDGTIWHDITENIALSVDERKWCSCKLGNIPIFSNAETYPVYWAPLVTSQVLQKLPFKPGANFDAMAIWPKVIRAHKNFLFALNLTESGTWSPNAFRWSALADVNDVPATWDETDLSNIAGKAALGANSGEILDGLSLRDEFCIYSTRAIHLLTYIGGDLIWSARTLSSNYGILATNCVVEVNGVHYFMSHNDIFMNDGGSIKSILHKQAKSIYNGFDPTNYKYASAVVDSNRDEIWFMVETTDTNNPLRAIIYNYMDGTLSNRYLPTGIVSAAHAPIIGETPLWSTTTKSWKNRKRPWNYDPTTPLDAKVVGLLTTGELYDLSSTEEEPVTVQNSYVSREDIALDNQQAAFTTRTVYPHIQCDDYVWISLGARPYYGGDLVWSEKKFDPSTQRKIDIRVSGTLLAWKVRSYDKRPFYLSGLDIEYELNGERY